MGCQSKIMDHHFERAISVDWKILLKNKEKPSTQGNLQLVLTFNKTLLKIKNVIDKHWHILSKFYNILWKFMKSFWSKTSMMEKVKLLWTSTSIIIGKVVNHKSQFWCVNNSTTTTTTKKSTTCWIHFNWAN